MAKLINEEALLKGDKYNKGWSQSMIDEFSSKLTALQSFQSYSYHHILLAANTTAAANYLFGIGDSADGQQGLTSLDRFMHPSYNEKFKAVDVPSGEGSYMVLINGLTDAEFQINSVEWEGIFVPNAGESNPHGSFVEGTMEVLEPYGVRFMNLLKHACDELKSDPNGIIFILKTVFVGWNDGAVQQVINVKPFSFVAVDIQGEFTVSGSSYTIEFVGTTNGITRMPALGMIQKSGLNPSGTVGSALNALQEKLNKDAQKSYDEMIAKLDESNNTRIAESSRKPVGRKVEYLINVDDAFRDLPLDNVNPRLQQTAGDVGLNTPTGIDLESAVTDIMLSATEVSKRMNKQLTDGHKQVFKVESALQLDKEVARVIISVRDCRVPCLVKDNTNKKGDILDVPIAGRPLVQFEYLYTGKNVEVLDYEMKMALGQAFFQTFGTSNIMPGSFSSASGNIETIGSGPGAILTEKGTIMREMSVIPISGTLEDQATKNKPGAADVGNFRMFMARWAFFESIQTKVKIAGIPAFLDGFNLLVDDVATNGLRAQVEGFPMIKVHVKMPNRDVDFQNGNINYAEDFWYDGAFMILSCKNIFRDGKFEQELELNAMPYDEMVNPGEAGGTGTTTEKNTPTQPKTQVQGTGQANKPAAGSSATQPKTPPVKTPEQEKKHGVIPPTLAPDVQLNCQTMLQQKYTTLADCKKVRLTQSFTLDQFIRRDINVTNDQHILTNICRVAQELEKVQAWLGTKIIITSGYRSPAFNNSVKGASKTSDHMKGLAVDCQFVGLEPIAVWEKLKNSPFNFRQCIFEHFGNSKWVHMAFDVDPTSPKQGGSTFFKLPK